MNDDEAVAGFLIEAGHLKRTPRTGWFLAGVRTPESVAEHSYRVGVIAYVLATMEGCNADRAAAMAVFHDLGETRTGDVPSVGKRHVTAQSANDVAQVQTANLPAEVGHPIRSLIAEFEARQSAEAQCAKDADKLECLLQAREYQAQGFHLTQPWVDTMLAAMKTESGRRLAQAATKVAVDAWWHDIVASYGRPAV